MNLWKYCSVGGSWNYRTQQLNLNIPEPGWWERERLAERLHVQPWPVVPRMLPADWWEKERTAAQVEKIRESRSSEFAAGIRSRHLPPPTGFDPRTFVSQQLEVYVAAKPDMREHYIARVFAATGWRPQDCTLVERSDGAGGFRVWLELKCPEDRLPCGKNGSAYS